MWTTNIKHFDAKNKPYAMLPVFLANSYFDAIESTLDNN